MPVFGKGGVIPRKLSRALGSAMWMYDLTGGARIGKLHKRISADEALAHMPTLPARAAGRVLPLLRRPGRRRPPHADPGPHRGHRLRRRGRQPHAGRRRPQGRRRPGHRRAGSRPTDDQAAPPTFDIAADAVVNAGGVWTDDVRASTRAPTPTRSARPRASTSPCRGRRCATTSPWSIPVPQDRRSVFVVPWGDLTYIGTTDTDYDGPLDDPAVHARGRRVPARRHQPRHHRRAHHRRRARHLGRPAPARARRRQRAHRRPVAPPPGHAVGQRHGHRHRRQAHDLPRDGRRHRRRRARAGARRAKVLERVAKHSRTRHLPLRGAEGYEELVTSAATPGASAPRRSTTWPTATAARPAPSSP